MLFKIGVLKKFAIFTGRHLMLESLFNEVAGLKASNFIRRDSNSNVFL